MKRLWLLLVMLMGGTAWGQTSAPICYPTKLNLDITDVPPSVSTRYQFNTTYGCMTPKVVVVYNFLQTQNDLALAFVNRSKTKAEQDAVFLSNHSVEPLTEAEKAFRISQLNKYGGSLTVSPNGTTPSRPVYGVDPVTGLRKTTAEVGARVATMNTSVTPAVPHRCWGERLVDATGKPTNYYSVEGFRNVASSDPNAKLGKVYTLCKLVAPPMGWN